jgi:hypothetical protein
MYKSAPENFTLDNFALGLDWASPPDRLSPMSVYDAKNINLTSYKALEKRQGMIKHYATPYVTGQKILDIYEYAGPASTRTLVASNTATESKVGYYNSGWNDLKTGLTKNTRFYFSTHNEYCFITNGVDANFKVRNDVVYSVGIVAPEDAPTVAVGASTGLTGEYGYVYCYVRSHDVGPVHRSNPSPVSDNITVSDESVSVSYVASTDAQVDTIEIYRTLDVSESELSTQYYLVETVGNEDGTFVDTKSDDSTTALCLTTNGVPPKSYFCALHKDRMIYANCPDEVDGDSLFMYSEIGRPEACPSANYQYFDRRDGQHITGIASLPDYLVVFKKNKMASLEGDFSKWYTISATTGCIAPWAITTFQDKILFLSAEGWKVTDGRSVQDVSKRLIALNRSQYISYTEQLNYSSAYYPTRKQILFLMNHSSYTKVMMVGHFLSSLYADVATENTVDEPYIGWTYHEYDYHTISALGRYTDSNGVEQVLAGDILGYVYLLDSGSQDDGNDISWKIETGWQSFNVPLPMTKQLRMVNFVYASNAALVTPPLCEINVAIDVDYTNDVCALILKQGAGTYCGYAYCNSSYPGIAGVSTENLSVSDSCVGRKFRFRISDTSGYDFSLLSISSMYRFAGLREGT